MSLNVIIHTPTKILCNIITEEIVLTTVEAELAIRPYHCKIVCCVPISLIRMRIENKWKLYLTIGGITRLKNDKLIFCLRDAEEVKSIDLIDIENKLNQAEERLKNSKDDEEKLQASENLQKLASLLKASAYL